MVNRIVPAALFALALGPGCAGPSWSALRPVPLAARTATVNVPAVTVAAARGVSFDSALSLGTPMPPASVAVQSGDVSSEPTHEPWARFGGTLGGVVAAVNSSVRVGLPGVGVSVDLEELLGLDTSTTTIRAEGFWRFTENRRHRFDVSWIDLSRRGDKTLSQEIDLGNGETIAVGAQVNTKLDMNLLRAAYSYSVFQDDRFDLALSGGLYVAPIEFDIQATGVTSFSTSFGITAPLPVVGLRMDFALTPRWYLRSDLNLFYIELSGFRGAISSATTSIEYRPWDHVAFGLGADSFNFAVDAKGSTSVPGVNEVGSVDFGYTGLLLYIKTLW